MPTEEGPQSLSWSGLFLQPKAPPISSVTQMLFWPPCLCTRHFPCLKDPSIISPLQTLTLPE